MKTGSRRRSGSSIRGRLEGGEASHCPEDGRFGMRPNGTVDVEGVNVVVGGHVTAVDISLPDRSDLWEFVDR